MKLHNVWWIGWIKKEETEKEINDKKNICGRHPWCWHKKEMRNKIDKSAREREKVEAKSDVKQQ